MSLTEDIAALINAEIARVTADKDAKIADLKAKLQDSEARWEHLRDLLGATPRRPDLMPPLIVTEDATFADFHKRRSAGFVSYDELGETLKITICKAAHAYEAWCSSKGFKSIRYTSSGQRLTE